MASLPVLFVSQAGLSPLWPSQLETDASSPLAAFLRTLRAHASPQQLRALLVVSANWEGAQGRVETSTGGPDLLFENRMLVGTQLQWPAPPASAVSARARALLAAAGFAVGEASRGFDHGVFVPLLLAFPAADVPTVQVSLHGGLGLADHLRLGRALAPLRAEGVLIICT